MTAPCPHGIHASVVCWICEPEVYDQARKQVVRWVSKISCPECGWNRYVSEEHKSGCFWSDAP